MFQVHGEVDRRLEVGLDGFQTIQSPDFRLIYDRGKGNWSAQSFCFSSEDD
ncbi:hypothetical protein NW761_009394 [Fusarium oxysporum]|nr:hypothetical protein NW761_009394 [Fusarium oxysporum]KAJ4094377.1 hypothetical protein NW769_012040 [Fusarium oxysporum]KAJ4218744.1 hypothetical protein NW760_012794 [Fusarium oxysporum]